MVVHQWRPGFRHHPEDGRGGDRLLGDRQGVDGLFDEEDEEGAAAGLRISVGPWSRPAVRGLVLLIAVIAVVAGYLVWQSLPRDVVVVPAAEGVIAGTSAAPADGSIRAPTDIAPDVLATGAPLTGSPGSQTAPAGPEADSALVEADRDDVAGQAEIVVHVTGLVRRPGLVRLPAGARVADAIDDAGGVTRRRAESSVNLARVLVDGEQIVVSDTAAAPALAPSAATTTAAAPGGPVDLNSATLEQLDALPGVGPVLAGRILQWRAMHGPFRSIDELGEVSGIGDAILGQLRPLVRV